MEADVPQDDLGSVVPQSRAVKGGDGDTAAAAPAGAAADQGVADSPLQAHASSSGVEEVTVEEGAIPKEPSLLLSTASQGAGMEAPARSSAAPAEAAAHPAEDGPGDSGVQQAVAPAPGALQQGPSGADAQAATELRASNPSSRRASLQAGGSDDGEILVSGEPPVDEGQQPGAAEDTTAALAEAAGPAGDQLANEEAPSDVAGADPSSLAEEQELFSQETAAEGAPLVAEAEAPAAAPASGAGEEAAGAGVQQDGTEGQPDQGDDPEAPAPVEQQHEAEEHAPSAERLPQPGRGPSAKAVAEAAAGEQRTTARPISARPTSPPQPPAGRAAAAAAAAATATATATATAAEPPNGHATAGGAAEGPSPPATRAREETAAERLTSPTAMRMLKELERTVGGKSEWHIARCVLLARARAQARARARHAVSACRLQGGRTRDTFAGGVAVGGAT
jgi:hypothetical protein